MANSMFKGVCLMNARSSSGTDGYKPWIYGTRALLQVSGNLGTGSITFAVLGADGNDVPVRDGSGTFTVTATGAYPVSLVNGQDVKATAATGVTSATVYLLSLGG